MNKIEQRNDTLQEINDKVDTALDMVDTIMRCYTLEPGMLTEITAAMATLKKEISELEIEDNNFDTCIEILEALDEEDINLKKLIETLPHSYDDILENIDSYEIYDFVCSKNATILKTDNLVETDKIAEFVKTLSYTDVIN